MKIKFKYSILFLLLCWFTASFAAGSPVAMLQSTSDQVIAQLKQNKATLKSNPKVVYQIVDKYLLPHVDLQGMARSVVGRTAWTNATPAQRNQFVQQFTSLLIHTYSSALASYQSETVQFLPMRSAANGTRTQVSSVIVRQGAPSIPVNYRLVLIGQQWKVYDFSVEGISMLESYRSQFSEQLNNGGGLDSLIQRLARHNA